MRDPLCQKDLDAIVWKLHDGIMLSKSMTSLNPHWGLWPFRFFWGKAVQTQSDRFLLTSATEPEAFQNWAIVGPGLFEFESKKEIDK